MTSIYVETESEQATQLPTQSRPKCGTCASARSPEASQGSEGEHATAQGCSRLQGTTCCQACEQNTASHHWMQSFPNNPGTSLMTQSLMTAQPPVAAANPQDFQYQHRKNDK